MPKVQYLDNAVRFNTPLISSKKLLKVYFAGKVKQNGFRQKLFGSRVMSNGIEKYTVNKGQIVYGGPFAIGDDHGGWHGNDFYEDERLSIRHASTIVPNNEQEYACNVEHLPYRFEKNSQKLEGNSVIVGSPATSPVIPPPALVERCLKQIKQADAIFACIEDENCYGTLIELGYANALNKPIYLQFMDSLIDYGDWWFIRHLPSVKSVLEEDDLFPRELLYFPSNSK
jgi:hypothetical protein